MGHPSQTSKAPYEFVPKPRSPWSDVSGVLNCRIRKQVEAIILSSRALRLLSGAH